MKPLSETVMSGDDAGSEDLAMRRDRAGDFRGPDVQGNDVFATHTFLRARTDDRIGKAHVNIAHAHLLPAHQAQRGLQPFELRL